MLCDSTHQCFILECWIFIISAQQYAMCNKGNKLQSTINPNKLFPVAEWTVKMSY